MISFNSSGEPLSAEFAEALQQPDVRFDMQLWKGGAPVQGTVKGAQLDLGAGYGGADLETFDPARVMTSQLEVGVYDLQTVVSPGDEIEVRVGVWTGSAFEYVTVMAFTVTECAAWQGITTIKGKGPMGRMNAPHGLATGDYSPSAAMDAIATAAGVSTRTPQTVVQNVHAEAGGSCRDLLEAMCARLGAFACELSDGEGVSIAVCGYNTYEDLPYRVPVSYITRAELGTASYEVDGLTVESSEGTYSFGTGRVHVYDPTATAATAAVTWQAMRGYSFMPGTLHAAIIDPRLTPCDMVAYAFEQDGTRHEYRVPANMSITYDGGYFGTYSAAGMTATAEGELVQGPLYTRVASAYELAEEAEQIAKATGQYFWHDSNGAHVSTEALDPEGAQNTLWNTEGMLFRRETDNLVAILAGDTAATSGMAVYDGQGNDAQNIVASFTGSGITVGRDGEQHVEIATESTDFFNYDGAMVGRIGSGETDIIPYERWTTPIIGESAFEASAVFSPLPDFTADNLVVTDDPDAPGLTPGLAYWKVTLAAFGTATADGVTVTAAQVDSDRWSLEVRGSTMNGDTVYARYRQTGAAPYYVFGTSNATGKYAFAEGYSTTASGDDSHSENAATTASGDCSHAEGNGSTASAEASHAEGYITTASAIYAHSEGEDTEASGRTSHAEGGHTTAGGQFSHAEGYMTEASGLAAHAEGLMTEASGDHSHSQGEGTVAAGRNQTVLGEYNVVDASPSSTARSSYPLIIGNGSSDSLRSNALTVEWSGDVNASGRVTANGVTSSDQIRRTTDIDPSTAPSATKYHTIFRADDADGTNMGYMQAFQNTSNVDGILLNAMRSVNGSTVYNGVTFGIGATGTRSVTVSDASAWRTALGIGLSTADITPTNATATVFRVITRFICATLTITALQLTAALANNQNITIGTVPEGYRPSTTMWAAAMGASSSYRGVYISVASGGTVTLYNRTGASLPASSSVYATLTWTR